MTEDPPDPARFSLADLLQASRSLLASKPEPILAYRLLRKIFRLISGFQPDGYRTIVVNLHQHVGSELARLRGYPQVTQ